LIKDSVLEALLVADYTNKMRAQNFYNFIVKFGTQAEICSKLEDLKWIFLKAASNLISKFYSFGQQNYFFGQQFAYFFDQQNYFFDQHD
jgi:hypothetical protein